MRARLVLVAVIGVGAVVSAGGAVAASAAPPPLPVSVTVGPNGVCVTVSLQTTHCVPLSAVQTPDLNQTLPVGLPYRKGDEVCWDPTPTSKGPCVPLNRSDQALPPPVTVTQYDGGVQVSTNVGGQPLVGVSDDSRGICYGFSYEVGRCVGPIS